MYEGKLLVVRHSDNSGFMALPGGHLERGEEIEECLSREIIEELRIKLDIDRLLYINTFADNNKQYVEFFFEIKNGVDYFNAKNLISSHSHEIVEMAWVSPIDDVNIMPKNLAEDFKAEKIGSDEIKYIKD